MNIHCLKQSSSFNYRYLHGKQMNVRITPMFLV